MNRTVNDYVDDVVRQYSTQENVTEEMIDNFIFYKLNLLAQIQYDESLSKEQLTYIAAKVKNRMSFTLEAGTALTTNNYQPWFKKRRTQMDEFRYWDRYAKYLRFDKNFSNKIVEVIDDVTDEIVDLVGDPTNNDPFQRRGLIIGDVQSGKTSNFIGMMCKACDVGYNLVIVLAGTDNTLRKQTQIRVEEGLLGYNKDDNQGQKIGAAKYSDVYSPISITSRSNDFSKTAKSLVGLSLSAAKEPIIFVIKKNVSVLRNLNQWIKDLNQADAKTGKIKASLLLVDDEADYASINTNDPETNPTKTNEMITELCGLFERTSYVGFTATPYANVFIDPESTDAMGNADLFPKDYIYCLNAPSNYIGARNIFGEDAKYESMIKTIDSVNESIGNPDSINNILPLVHKKENSFEKVPDTMKIAIYEFLLGNTIRDIWGDVNSHRSMLINISRFVLMHEKIKTTVEEYLNDVVRDIKLYSKLPNGQWQTNKVMKDLYNVYKSEMSKIVEDEERCKTNGRPVINWEVIRKNLYASTATIVVRIANSSSKDSMDYEKFKDGLRVIAIGGIRLSRGLTLEGLMVSYFYRSSKNYDTLMQMGRWFGYRDGYVELCRIWMTDQSEEWYRKINEATEELRALVSQYKDSGLTPLDFGIRVRDDSFLMITARNKMRSASTELVECTLSSRIVETAYLSGREEHIISNYNSGIKFLEKLESKYELKTSKLKHGKTDRLGYYNVHYTDVIDLLRTIEVPLANIVFQNDALIKFIEDNRDELSLWDIYIPQGDGPDLNYTFANHPNIEIKTPKRSFDIKPNTESLVRISKSKVRVGSPSDGRFGMSDTEYNNMIQKYQNKIGSSTYFYNKRKPLLSLYFIEATSGYKENDISSLSEKAHEIEKLMNGAKLFAVSLGIPNLGKKERKISYAVSKIWKALQESAMDLTEDEENGEE